MNKRIQRWSAAGAVAAVLAAGFVSPALADDATQDQLDQAKAAETQTSQSIAGLEVSLAQLAAESNDLSLKVAEAEAKSVAAERALTDAIGDAAAAHEAADAAADKANEAKEELGKVSKAIYRDGATSISGVNYLFGAKSLSDANARARAYKLVGDDANKSVQKYEALQSVADSMQKEADKKSAAQQAAANEAQAATDAVTQAKADVDSRSAEISSSREDLITKLAAQKGTTADIERQLQEQKEAAAAAEAKAQQEAILAAAQQEATRPSTPTTTAPAQPVQSSTPEPTTPAPQPTTLAPQPQPTTPAPQPTTPAPQPTTPVETPAPSTGSGSATGQAIVNTAMSYVGSPYVWAGLTPAGWDCIGFVRYVYKQYGVSIGGYTTSVLSVGTRVPYSQARPGDILYWPGHVAISLGNGMNVGAWNESWGTRVGKDSWIGTPTVIRVFN
ncbi:C40 family peptidase [Arcanobacterium haemolyticum]|nr:C40 family peptidase [Arcanobacterium haemolyticum]